MLWFPLFYTLWISQLLLAESNYHVRPDYYLLQEYAHIASFSYCIKKGLTRGKLGNPNTQCHLSLCETDAYNNIEVLGVYNFNEMRGVGSAFYAIDDDNKRILLVFRGTSSMIDWFANLNAFPRKYEPLVNLHNEKHKIKCDGCKVHKGFYEFLRKNCADVLSAVRSVKDKNPDYKLIVVGHSLGASLALLSGIEFQLMNYDPLVIAYASPKVGNQLMMDFVDDIFSTSEVYQEICDENSFHKGYIRVVHDGDMVPSLPPTNLFSHGGIEYLITKKDLPHEPNDILPPNNYKPQSKRNFPTSLSLGKLWPDSYGKYEHTNYFVKITSCDP